MVNVTAWIVTLKSKSTLHNHMQHERVRSTRVHSKTTASSEKVLGSLRTLNTIWLLELRCAVQVHAAVAVDSDLVWEFIKMKLEGIGYSDF